MPTDQDRHMLIRARIRAMKPVFPPSHRRAVFRREAPRRDHLLVQSSGDRAVHYVPLPKLIQE